MRQYTSYRYRDKAKRPKVKAKQKVLQFTKFFTSSPIAAAASTAAAAPGFVLGVTQSYGFAILPSPSNLGPRVASCLVFRGGN